MAAARRREPAVRSSKSTGFGTNPGALRMFAFVPEQLPRAPALVVVLHGCGQTAAGYDFGTGWSTLAKRYGFALLMPEQQASNNANTCFNWFNPGDVARGRGEAASIRQMIARMVADHKIDPRRIYITGLSAGGAMTSVMLAAYPEVFAGGAIIAGLPFGIASNVREALGGMMQSTSRPADELGDLVRKASKHKGPWPKVSVWHGSADRTVNPGQRQRNRQAMARRSRPAVGADVGPAMSTAIRARSGGMPMARPSSSPTPSPTWPTARRSDWPAMTSPMARKARS